MILSQIIFWFQSLRFLPTQSMVEDVSTLVLLAATILVYRTFREWYLLIWIVGWVLYFVSLEALAIGPSTRDPRLATATTYVAFILSVTFFVVAVLFYTNSRKYLLLVGLLAAFGVDIALVRVFWLPSSTVLLYAMHAVYHVIAVVGAIRLALFSRGRRELGPWMLTVMLLLLHLDESPGAVHWGLPGVDTGIMVLLGLGMLFLVLDDSKAHVRRLAVVNALTTAIAEARDHGTMMKTGLTQLKKLFGARAAWFRSLEEDLLVIEQQIDMPEEYLRKFREIPLATSHSNRLMEDRVAAKIRTSMLESDHANDAAGAGFEHLLLVPVSGKTSALGILCLGMPRARSYTPDEMRFLTTTANQLGIAAENLRMVEQIVRSQRQWVRTFDSIADLVLVHDCEQRILNVNRALLQRLGKRHSEVVGKTCAAILPNAAGGCPYCFRAQEGGTDGPDACFGGYSMVSTSSYTEELGNTIGTVHIIADTTDRRAADERYRLLFEEAQEGVFVSTPEGRLLDCNTAFIRLLGYDSRAEVLSMDIATQLYKYPEDRVQFMREMRANGYVRNHEVIVRRKDGTSITLLENSFATRHESGRVDRYQGFLVDITEKKRAEEDIQRRNHELYALNAIAVVATQSFDLDEILNVTLRQVVDLFAADMGAILVTEPDSRLLRPRASFGLISPAGPSVLEIEIPEDFWERLVAARAEIITEVHGPKLPPVMQRLVEDEKLRAWMWVVMWSQNRPLGVIGVSTRLDREFAKTDENLICAIGRQLASTIEKVRLYEETSRAYENLRQTQEQLLQSEKMSAVGQLIAGVAHELNNPLTAILGYAQLLESEPLGERASDFVAKLYRQTQRTHRVVLNLLSFARQRKPHKQAVDLRRILNDTLALREYDLKINNITVERHYDAQAPMIFGDAHQLEQVFLNIVNNAVDSMLENARGGTLSINIRNDDNDVFTEIKDTGNGIREPNRVFDPFYTTKKVGKGTGLGLSICYGIIQEHGGDISASNHPDGGALFAVRFPLAIRLGVHVQGDRPGNGKKEFPGCVLVVEDEQVLLEFEIAALKQACAGVASACSGSEAIQLLSEGKFGAIIIDGRLSGPLSASDVYHWIVENQPHMRQRIVFTLPQSGESELRSFLTANNLPSIAKPFAAEDLLAAIQRMPLIEASRDA